MFCTYAGATAALNNPVNPPWFLIVVLVASFIAAVAFVVTGVIYLCQYIKLREKAKTTASHKELTEAFKMTYPEWTHEQVEIAATGRTEPYLEVEGLDDDGWRAIR